uniref:Uncharacterized protein n=1 Tax=Rhizophora mucronata TaxID=61149 RepID=A0A2P2P3X9_RHIMU
MLYDCPEKESDTGMEVSRVLSSSDPLLI